MISSSIYKIKWIRTRPGSLGKECWINGHCGCLDWSLSCQKHNDLRLKLATGLGTSQADLASLISSGILMSALEHHMQ